MRVVDGLRRRASLSSVHSWLSSLSLRARTHPSFIINIQCARARLNRACPRQPVGFDRGRERVHWELGRQQLTHTGGDKAG